MKIKLLFINLCIGFVAIVSCNSANNKTETITSSADSVTSAPANTVNIKEDPVTYSAGGTNFKGYVAYDSNKTGKRPAVLVVHEWWGLNDYPRSRAKQLAEFGYIAMAVDMFGDGKTAADPKQAMDLTQPFYKLPLITKSRLDAAINKLKEYQQTDTSRMAAIGYCFGGFVVLNAAKLGADLKGVVSFHGDLSGVPVKKDLLKAKILVCHGEADKFVTPQHVAAFKKSMDSVNADYTFKSYPHATHAFTNPSATENGKKFNIPIEYNAAADSSSWNDMKSFFEKLF
ncbi:MAG: dienelactone hydrolase family protein [Ginsengibacter sp.]